VRYFIVLAALMVTACSLPGVPGMGSFMTAAHPTQEYCASRGLTLDAAIQQCVVPPASQGAQTTGSLPSQASLTEKPPSPPAPPVPAQQTVQQPRPQQSQPQQPIVQPEQHQAQEQRASLSVSIEPKAVIKPDSPQNSEMATEYAHFVRATGYRCDSVSSLAPRPGGVTLVCNQSAFRYAIKDKDKDGRWIVTLE
jgi:hypothetical protein